MRLVETVPIRLTSPEHRRHARAEPFSALFRLRSGPPLCAGTRGVWHPALGQFDLFLERVGAGAAYYEAVLQ